ncbi:MAG: hypothetical protein RL272_783 [Candidatus Parcubacteria bacterium]|jgi:PAS domain S-box-containing protein
MHEAPREAPRERVFIRSLAGRVALLVLFSSLAVAGIAVASAIDLRTAVMADADASTGWLAAAAAVAEGRFVGDAGKALAQAADASRRGGPGACDAAASDIAARDGRFVAVGVATPQGSVVCGFPAGQPSVAGRVSVKRAIASRAFAMGDYVVDAAAARSTVGFAMPVLDGGELKGVAFVEMDVKALSDGGLSSALPPDAAFGIVDGRAVMLMRYPEPDRWAGQPLPESALSAEMLSRKEGTVRLDGFDGIARIYSFRRLPELAAPSAYVYVGVPVVAAEANARAAALRGAAIALFLVIIALWAALTMGDMLILRRMRKMVGTMRHIVIGELDERADLPRGFGELDEVTGLFDIITARLKEAYGKTEEKVKVRTVELEFNKGMAELEKARTEALLASIGEGVVATDRDGKIIFFNKWAQDMIGLDTDLAGKSIYSAITLQDEKGAMIEVEARPIRIALTTGKRVESPLPPKPLWMAREGGKPFPIQIVVTPVRHDEETIGAIAVFRDITDEMEIDRRKSEFISIASHQLRSPLTGIKWLTDMLRKGDLGKLDPKQQKVADQIFEANERLVSLVNELLNVSRLEVGTTKPSPVMTDMAKLMHDAIADFEPVLAAKKQALKYDAGAMPTIFVDPLLTREVVANLLSNASKYSPDGSTVTLSAKEQEGEFRISVSDQGIGIPPADQKKMFQKFFRAENAAKSSITGTGLGLYVVKSVVELQGGRIWFESAVGKGTTFYVTFPLNKQKTGASGAA